MDTVTPSPPYENCKMMKRLMKYYKQCAHLCNRLRETKETAKRKQMRGLNGMKLTN